MHYERNWEATREAIKVRDQKECMNCGATGESITLDIHHIVPRSQGGSDQMSNLVLLCRQCHDAAHGKKMAPTVDFRTSGEMRDEEFTVYRDFFNKLPSARYNPDNKEWRVPVADMEMFIESFDKMDIEENVEESSVAD